jgi:hypothetical protein
VHIRRWSIAASHRRPPPLVPAEDAAVCARNEVVLALLDQV